MTNKEANYKLIDFIASRQERIDAAIIHAEDDRFVIGNKYDFCIKVLEDNYAEIKGAVSFAYDAGLIDDDTFEEFTDHISIDMRSDRRKASRYLGAD